MTSSSSMPQNGRPMLEAVDLTKRYREGNLALDHISFQVFPGQIYAMLGANGAGKTTTMHLFLNFIEPTEGEARIDGVVTHEEPLRAKEHVGFVSENVMLYAHFTAMQNLDFFCRLGGKRRYTPEDYRATLLKVGLPEEAHHKRLRTFSKGMRQKCGIAIAVLKNTPAILLDEPTSGLDPQAGYEFVQLLRRLREDGRAILLSTHDLFRAREVADVIGIMKQGRLVMQRSADELRQENLEELYMRYMAGA